MYNEKMFAELSEKELVQENGGGAVEAAVAVVTLAGAALVGGFNAGRQVVRDVKKKFF